MGGHIIIREQTREALIDPLVWASLPTPMQGLLRPIFYNADGSDRDPLTWDVHECWLVGCASSWAVSNL